MNNSDDSSNLEQGTLSDQLFLRINEGSQPLDPEHPTPPTGGSSVKKTASKEDEEK